MQRPKFVKLADVLSGHIGEDIAISTAAAAPDVSANTIRRWLDDTSGYEPSLQQLAALCTLSSALRNDVQAWVVQLFGIGAVQPAVAAEKPCAMDSGLEAVSKASELVKQIHAAFRGDGRIDSREGAGIASAANDAITELEIVKRCALHQSSMRLRVG